MRSRSYARTLLALLLVGGTLLAAHSLLSRSSPRDSAFPSLPVPSTGSTTETLIPPVRLQVPDVRIDARIESVGVNETGAMGIPTLIEDVAWFNGGPLPGRVGSAVIGGHYGWKDNRPSAFDNLQGVRVGALIYVTDADGLTSTFKVRTIKTYAWNADAKEIFTSTDGKAHLNLITCAGVWDVKNHTYLKRIVVFADKIE